MKDTKAKMGLNPNREIFSSGLAVFLATLGSAIGLGNMWKFPYLTGSNGGGAFVFAYILCVFLVGVPVMVAEFYIGRKSRRNAVGAFEKLRAKPFWKIIGYMGVGAAFLIMFFYSAVAGWVYSYVFKALKGEFSSLGAMSTKDAATAVGGQFDSFLGTYSTMVWQIAVMVVVSIILIAGVKNGIERITKTLMPVLFMLIIICDIRALTLPGASEGVKFLFHVDFSKLTPPVILSALGLAFFKLSIGMGTMITYGSYFTHDNNMIATSTKVALSDTVVSILAGLAIFPAIFAFGVDPAAKGSGLFSTIPLVFSRMTFGNLLIIAFFLLTAIAATTAMISLVEVPVAFFSEEMGLKRKNSVILTSSIMVGIGLLTVHSKSVLGSATLFGKSLFDLYDFVSSNILLLAGGLLLAIFVGYIANKDDVKNELSNNGQIKNDFIIKIYFFIIRYIAPALIILVFLNSIGILKLK